MKLYNHTAIPDEILEPVLRWAAKVVRPRVRHNKVIVRINRAKYNISGRAKAATWVRKFALARTEYTKGSDYRKLRKGEVKTDGGWMICRIPKAGQPLVCPSQTWRDPLYIAEKFFWLCVHEWAHVRDAQSDEPGLFRDYHKHWANRPHEIRAQCVVRDAKEQGIPQEVQDAIINLAVWLEEEVSK